MLTEASQCSGKGLRHKKLEVKTYKARTIMTYKAKTISENNCTIRENGLF
jgi:hypothetical protein